MNRLRRQLAEARRERDAARFVIAAMADDLGELAAALENVTEQRDHVLDLLDQADAAQRAAECDLGEILATASAGRLHTP